MVIDITACALSLSYSNKLMSIIQCAVNQNSHTWTLLKSNCQFANLAIYTLDQYSALSELVLLLKKRVCVAIISCSFTK